MSRRGIVAGGALVAAAVAGAAAWWFVLRDPTEPVDVAEVVTSFRTETEPGGASPIPEGVYVYATNGLERTSALTGKTHRYPKRSTITVTAADCGVSLRWQVLDGRSTEWVYCVTDDGWELASQDERHTFFGTTESTTYTCEGTPIRPRERLGPDERWAVSCETEDAGERGIAFVVARETQDVGGESVETEHVRKKTEFSGAIRGFAQHDLWFDSKSGVPVKIAMVSQTRNDSPVGEVTYDEDVTLVLSSLEPRR
jgi:hypothetical protein